MCKRKILAVVSVAILLDVKATQFMHERPTGRPHKQNLPNEEIVPESCEKAWSHIEEYDCPDFSATASRAKRFGEDKTGKQEHEIESQDTRDCNLWADPHVSGFDNTDLKGPEYLYLLAKKSTGDAVEMPAHRRSKLNITYSTNMSTFDRRPVDVNALDAGDFWLVKSEAVHIQGRFRLAQEFLPDNAAIGALAVGGPFLNGDKIIIEPLDGQMMLNAHPMPAGNFAMQTSSGNFSVASFRENVSKPHGEGEMHADVTAELPMGVNLKIRRWRRHLDVNIKMPNLPGGVDGECGNMNGDPSDDTEDHIKKRMGSIMIEPSAKLFLRQFNVQVNLDEEGFNAVQSSRDPHAMRNFIHLLLANSEAQVLSEADLSGLIPYYNGELDRKSYHDLLRELMHAEWVQGFDPPTKNMLEKAFDSVMNRVFR